MFDNIKYLLYNYGGRIVKKPRRRLAVIKALEKELESWESECYWLQADLQHSEESRSRTRVQFVDEMTRYEQDASKLRHEAVVAVAGARYLVCGMIVLFVTVVVETWALFF